MGNKLILLTTIFIMLLLSGCNKQTYITEIKDCNKTSITIQLSENYNAFPWIFNTTYFEENTLNKVYKMEFKKGDIVKIETEDHPIVTKITNIEKISK